MADQQGVQITQDAPQKPKVMTEEEFFKEYDKPKVLSRIVGFAGLDPCRKGA